MDKHALLYIVTPIVLVFIVYMLIITITWPLVRTRSIVPLYLLLLIIVFPPGFLFFIFWFYLIHLGFVTSRFYIYELEERERQAQEDVRLTRTQQNAGVLSQKERKSNNLNRV